MKAKRLKALLDCVPDDAEVVVEAPDHKYRLAFAGLAEVRKDGPGEFSEPSDEDTDTQTVVVIQR